MLGAILGLDAFFSNGIDGIIYEFHVIVVKTFKVSWVYDLQVYMTDVDCVSLVY